MTVRIYLDEDTNSRLVKSLRRGGFDCLTTTEAGRSSSLDEEQLAFAASQGRVLVTRNVSHFYALHRFYLENNLHHAGIIIIPPADFKRVNRALLEFLSQAMAEDMQDNIEFLSDWF